MLNTTKLINAKIPSTKNWFLETVWNLVKLYNASPNLPNIEKTNVLERILVGAGEWLTSHPPKATPTNQARWAAMDDLAQQVINEGVKLGARFLTGPTNWKLINGNMANRSYWLEYLSPQHGVGYQLAPVFAAWRNHGQPHESFWDYAKIHPPQGPLLVKYYGGTAKAEKRRVEFKEDGKLYYAISGALFHSQPLTTVVSGAGWAIFVVSPEGKMYAHKHVTGIYHHSTFLSGSAVMAAGELVVDQGVVKFITAKSGHYIPTPENMRAFIRQFPKIPGQAVIMPDFKSNPPPAHRVAELKFTSNPRALKRAQATAVLPGWANKNNNVINKIPP